MLGNKCVDKMQQRKKKKSIHCSCKYEGDMRVQRLNTVIRRLGLKGCYVLLCGVALMSL